MWWYRDRKAPDEAPEDGGGPAGPAVASAGAQPRPTGVLAAAAAHARRGRADESDLLLLMSLLVDSRIEFEDGAVADGLPWQEAERTLSDAAGARGPLRLYNRFAREFGDGYSRRADLPAAHEASLARLRTALAAAPGVRSVTPK